MMRAATRQRLCALFAIGLWLITAGAAARRVTPGTIRGRVEIANPAAAPERRPNIADLGTPPPRDLGDRHRAVIYLETAPRGAFEDREPGHARLHQRNESFVPHVLPIPVGTTVDFPNDDRTYHNVFSLSKTRRFDLGRYAAGQSRSVKFDRPGVVRVFCDIHSHMSAFILVFSHPFFAATDTDGRYHIDNVPPGTYAVTVWYEGISRGTRSISVTEGSTAELDFAVP